MCVSVCVFAARNVFRVSTYVRGHEGWRRQQNSKTNLKYEPKVIMLRKTLEMIENFRFVI
jgi:hypothetical protein